MEIVLAITGTILIVIQFQRNLLLKKQLEKQTITNVTVQPAEIDYDSLARAMEASWPTVNVTNELNVDYDKLADAISKTQPVTIPTYPIPVPQYPTPPSPTWQQPVISKDSTNEVEIEGVKGKQFPAR